MRKLLRSISLLACLALLSLNTVSGQDIKIEFELKSMSEGSFPAFVTMVEGADEKLAYTEWRDLMKDYGGKTKRSKPERCRTDQVIISSIGGSDPLDLFADFDGKGAQVKVMVWIKQRGEFINSASAERDVESAQALMTEFHLKLKRAGINQELEGEQTELEKLEKKLKNLERDHDGYLKDIERAKEAISRAENNIKENEKEQESTRTLIEQAAEDVKAVQEKLDGVKG